MPKTPRDCSHDRLVKFLQKNGWQLVREGARHTVMGRDGFAPVTVPRHSVLKTGTVNAILNHCGLRDHIDDL